MYVYILILLAGIALCAIAFNFFKKHRLFKAEVQIIRATETADIADLRKIHLSIAEEMGLCGTWREQVQVKGTVISGEPLTAKLSSIPCVYCNTVVEEQYERTEYETNDDGETEEKDVIDTKIFSSSLNWIDFYLEDRTDKILINPHGAEIDGLTVVNKFESLDEEKISGYRTLGYQRTEKIIELESEVYILGEVKEIDGRLQIGASTEDEKPFIISYRSESELIKQRQRLGRGKLLWGIVLLLHGFGLIVLALGLLLI